MSVEKYVAASCLRAVLIWVAIIASKLARLERDAGEIAELARRKAEREAEPEPERDEVGV